MKAHTDTRDFKCELCERTFTRSHYLQTHMMYHLKKEEEQDTLLMPLDGVKDEIRKFACDKCSKRYKQKTSLDTHQYLQHHLEMHGLTAEATEIVAIENKL